MPPFEPGPIDQQILSLPVSFGVINVNRSKVPCTTDGQPYTIRGHLVGPDTALTRASRTISLYVHGGTAGEFQWTLKDVPGYDHATEMAKLGHTSVVIDRLGIDSSGHPVGTQTCVGGEADVIHQVADLLRTGSYELAGGSGVTFDRIALIGSSLASLIVEVAAGSFDSFDAVSVSGWGDLIVAATPPLAAYALDIISVVAPTCARGGEPAEAEPGSPTGYTTVFSNPRRALETLLYDPDPDVVASLAPRINREGCGLFSSYGTAVAVNTVLIQSIRKPVLIVHGAHDFVVSAEGARLHAARFINSDDVTLTTMERAGHGPNLERAAPEFRRVMSEWLSARGY